jgi:hypothetical protein
MKPKKNPIALNLPQIVALLIVYGRHIVQAMTNNPWFPSPTPPLATVTTDLNALEAAEATALTRAKGSASARDLAQRTVETDLTGLKAYTSSVVALSPAQAAAIIESAGMAPKRVAPRNKPQLAVAMGATPGEGVLRAKAVGRGAAYEWQYSSDGGKTWAAIGITTVANTTVMGLSAGTVYLFRFRTTRKKVTGDWSQTVSFLAH